MGGTKRGVAKVPNKVLLAVVMIGLLALWNIFKSANATNGIYKVMYSGGAIAKNKTDDDDNNITSQDVDIVAKVRVGSQPNGTSKDPIDVDVDVTAQDTDTTTNASITRVEPVVASAKVPLPTSLKIFHVVNFYSSVPNNNHNHNTNESSLDQIQSLTMASIIRAHKHVMALSHMDIRLVGAVFPEDAHVIPDDFEIRYLNRSTVSEYSNSTLLTKKTKLPFLQDLIRGVVTDEDKDDFDYFIYTNSEIGLDPSFYSHVVEIIGRGYDAFSINRHNLPDRFYQPALEQSTLDLEQLYSIHAMGFPHPGKDCFVISKAVWQKLYLGTLFVGHPPWGHALDRILKQVATNYYNIKSHEDVTFHLGNDRGNDNAWNKDKIKLTEPQRRLVWSCPRHASRASPYSLTNMINCAALFDLFEGQNRTYKYA
jgi:hypothetical protein